MKRLASRHPGRPLRDGLREMAQYLPQRPGGEPYDDLQPRVVQYLTTVLETKARRPMSVRNSRELRTLAQALDSILVGNIALAADTLMMRFQAVELAAEDASWEVSQHLELIPPVSASSVGGAYRKAAAKEALTEARLGKHLRGSQGQREQERGAQRDGRRGSDGDGFRRRQAGRWNRDRSRREGSRERRGDGPE